MYYTFLPDIKFILFKYKFRNFFIKNHKLFSDTFYKKSLGKKLEKDFSFIIKIFYNSDTFAYKSPNKEYNNKYDKYTIIIFLLY